jgi:hypothetical protein
MSDPGWKSEPRQQSEPLAERAPHCYAALEFSGRAEQAEKPMKSYPVVRIVSCLAAGACLAACSSNGALFDEVSDMGAPAGEPGAPASDEAPEAMSPEDVSPGDVPSITNPPGDEPSNEQPGDDDLPLTGGFPTPPVNDMPDPPEAVEEPPAPEPEGPVVVAVSPPDGALGVDNAQNIVITFSEPMVREA